MKDLETNGLDRTQDGPEIPEWVKQYQEQQRQVEFYEVTDKEEFWNLYNEIPIADGNSRADHIERLVSILSNDIRQGNRPEEIKEVLRSVDENAGILREYEYIIKNKLDHSTINKPKDYNHLVNHLSESHKLPKDVVVHAILNSNCLIEPGLRQRIQQTENSKDPMDIVLEKSGFNTEEQSDIDAEEDYEDNLEPIFEDKAEQNEEKAIASGNIPENPEPIMGEDFERKMRNRIYEEKYELITEEAIKEFDNAKKDAQELSRRDITTKSLRRSGMISRTWRKLQGRDSSQLNKIENEILTINKISTPEIFEEIISLVALFIKNPQARKILGEMTFDKGGMFNKTRNTAASYIAVALYDRLTRADKNLG